MKQRIYAGSEIKLNIHIEPLDGLTMEDYDFKVDVFTSAKNHQTITKAEAKKVDANNYLIMVDTSRVGLGPLRCGVTAYIPDGDFDDALRTEFALIETGLVVEQMPLSWFDYKG